MLSPTIFFAVVVGTIFAFQTFGQIDLLTQGGPLKKTNVLAYSIYTDAARSNERRQGRGARDRAVRRSRWCSRWSSCASSSGGCTMPAERDATRRRTRARPERAARRRRRPRVAALRCCSRVLAVIVLFPIYITVVNSLLHARPDRGTAADVLPDRPAVGHVRDGVERRAHRHVPAEQLRS